MVAHRLCTDLYPADAQVGELGLIDVQPLIEGDGDLVNDAVATLLPDVRLDESILPPVHIVVPEDGSDLLDAGTDSGVIVRGRVLAQQVLQDVGGDDGVALDGLDEVLADDDAGEGRCDLAVQGRGGDVL